MRIRFWKRGEVQTTVSSRRWLLASLLLIHASCAKVGDPLPPLVRIPAAVDAHLVQQGWDRVEILIPPVLGEIKEVEIYRECGNSLPAEFEGSLVAQVGAEDVVKDSVTGFFVLDDPKPVFDEPCRYQIRVRNQQLQTAGRFIFLCEIFITGWGTQLMQLNWPSYRTLPSRQIQV